ncbi:restriction endonuclease, partial [Candidatus Woesearchaeota archaeon]|nr:restriction endonuclease [Candidatus Woesearchaeota archaeon]
RHLTRIINDEEGEQRYQRFKKQMLHNQPKKISDYLRNYIKLNSECEDYLLRLLDEMKVKLPEDFNLTNKLLRIEDELDLETFEKKLHTHAKNKPDFEQMGGFEFQDFLKELFKKMGYNTQPTKKTGDQGADLIIERFGQTWIVQAKNYNESIVDNSAIQEAVGAIKYYKADNAIVVTTSTFTKSAKELANANDVKLINGHGLDDLVKKYW